MRKLLVALCTIAAMTPAGAEPLKIAIMEPLSGPWTEIGKAFHDGDIYAIKKLNQAGGLNGQPIEVIVYDNLGSPPTASEKLKDAIDKGVNVIASASFTAVAAQLAADVKRHNLRNPGKEILFLNNGSEGYDLTAERCHPWFFHAATNAYIRFGALVKAMKDQNTLGDKVYLINPNYSYGKDAQAAQEQAVKAAGATIVGNDLHDLLKLQDFGPFVAKIKASGAQSVLTSNFGSDLTLLLKAARDAGLSLPIANQSLDAPGTVASAGEAAAGSYLAKLWILDAGGEAGRAFNEDFKATMGSYPSYEQATATFSLMLLAEAVKKADFGGGPIKVDALAKALETVSWDSPIGPWSFRKEDHQLLSPLAIGRVSKEAKYKAEGSDMGFALVKVLAPQEAAVPVSPKCKME